MKQKLQLSPIKLPLKPGVIASKDSVFDGLFGVFNDSLPDGWGRLLLDRKLMAHGLNPADLSPLTRLCFVGSSSMGALCYEPEEVLTTSISEIDLDTVSEEIKDFQSSGNVNHIDRLLRLNGSSAGARPKILLNSNGEKWIIKFKASIDPLDIGNIEYAYSLMANQAKLDVPKTKLFHAKNKQEVFFGTKRFDRNLNESIHMHTISGLLHADHRIPCLDYESILKATMFITRDMRECEKQFRLCSFNVLAHNRDDHAKNFSFLMNSAGSWSVAPAYDLTFSSGPNGEHCSTIMGEGKNPTVAHLQKLAAACGLKKTKATEIIDEVKSAVAKWMDFADMAEVKPSSKKLIASILL